MPKRSHLEQLFELHWERLYPEVDLWAEQKLIPHRRFRFDFVHYPSKTAIEVNGGNWGGGRHTRAGALNQEYEKILLAALEGYTVIFLSQDQIDEEYLEMVHQVLVARSR
mgnify:FL=1